MALVNAPHLGGGVCLYRGAVRDDGLAEWRASEPTSAGKITFRDF